MKLSGHFMRFFTGSEYSLTEYYQKQDEIMIRKNMIAVCTGLTVLAAAPVLAAPNARTIMTKMAKVYKNANTYQATWSVNTQVMAMKVDSIMQMKQKGKQFLMNMHPAKDAQGPMAMAMNQHVVCNGKKIYDYIALLNKYTVIDFPSAAQAKKMGQGMMPGMTGSINSFATVQPGQYKLLKASKIGATPVWVILYHPTGKIDVTNYYYINRDNYHIKMLRIAMKQGATPINVEMTVVSEILNKPIANTLFQFVPPKGATKLDIPAGAMMGKGMP